MELVQSWMDDETLVSPDLGLFRRSEMWMMLRILNGLDLPDFLAGCRQAYPMVTTLMYEREWADLEPLVAPHCLEAMKETMDIFRTEARRVQVDSGSDIEVQSVQLRRAQVLSEGPRGSCHLDVHFVVNERFTIWDYHTNEAIPPFDGSVRTQRSTWRFEGVVAPPHEGGGGAGERGGREEEQLDAPEDEVDWRLFSIVE